MSEIKTKVLELMKRSEIEIVSQFVPFSVSRNAKPKTAIRKAHDMSLNWKVTLKYRGRDIIATDYSAGIGHSHVYKSLAIPFGRGMNMAQFEQIWNDVESGFKNKPDPVDVLHSLNCDSEVLNYSGFEDWADCMGFDSDSRKAEQIYRACLDIALKFSNGISSDIRAELMELLQDY